MDLVHRAVRAVLDLLPAGTHVPSLHAYPPPQTLHRENEDTCTAFSSFWSNPQELVGAPLIILTAERVPHYAPVGAVNLLQITTVYDWVVTAALGLRETLETAHHERRDHSLDEFPFFVIVDVISSLGSGWMSGDTLQELAAASVWCRVIRRDEIGSAVATILASAISASSIVRSSHSSDSTEFERRSIARSRRITTALDIVRTLWRGRLTDAGAREDRHAIANLIGPQVLLPKEWASPHDGVRALRQLLASLDLISEISAPLTIRALEGTHLVLIDDLAEYGWSDFVKRAVGATDDQLTVVTDVQSAALVGTIETGCATVDNNGKRLTAGFSFTGRADEILLLDLRLFSRARDERAFCQKLLTLAHGSGLLQDLPKTLEELPRSDDMLTLLPRLVAALDPSLPIIIFSSTGSRRVAEILSKVPNVILDFEKPRFYGDRADREHTYQKFARALEKAAQFANARRFVRTIVAKAATISVVTPPPRLHVFIDESAADQQHLAVGAVLLGTPAPPVHVDDPLFDYLEEFNRTIEGTSINDATPDEVIYWNLSETSPQPDPLKKPIPKEPDFDRQNEVLRALNRVLPAGYTLQAASLRGLVPPRRGDDALDDRNLDNLYRRLVTDLLEFLLFDVYHWTSAYAGSVTVDVATRLGIYRGSPEQREKERESFFRRFGIQPTTFNRRGVREQSDRTFYSFGFDHAVPLLSAVEAVRSDQRLPRITAARGARLVQPDEAQIRAAAMSAEQPFTIVLPHQIHYLADWVARWANMDALPEDGKGLFLFRAERDAKHLALLRTAFRTASHGDYAAALGYLHDAMSADEESIPFFGWIEPSSGFSGSHHRHSQNSHVGYRSLAADG